MENVFSEIVDLDRMQGILENLCGTTGIPGVLVDSEGRVLASVQWRNICSCFHRIHPDSAERCRKSEEYLQSKLRQEGPLPPSGFFEYRCEFGMVDLARPILVQGRHLASLLLGQFFYAPPDEGFFLEQARHYDYDEDRYLEALRQVPVLPRERVEALLGFQSRMIDLLVEDGLRRLELLQVAREKEQIARQLEATQRIARVGSWDWDLQTGELACTPQALRNLGQNEKTFLPTYHFLLGKVHPDDREAVRHAIDQARVTGEVWVEHRIRRPDGSIGYLLEQGEVEFDAHRRPLRMQGTCHDITEQKQIEIALLESERRLQNILDNSNALIYLKGLDGRFRFANSYFEKLFGLHRGQAIGSTDFDLFAAEQAEHFRANDRAVMTSDVPLQFEETVSLEDGVHTYLSVKFPLRDSEGHSYAICGISTDISERKEAEEMVREALALAEEASENVRAVFEAVADGLIVTDAQRRVALINRSAEQLLGVEAGRGNNRALDEMVQSAELRRHVEASFDHADGLPVEFFLPCRDGGAPLTIQARSAAVQVPGRGAGSILTILRDVTRERELDQMKNDFISTAAHELRTPLTSVLGFAQVLLNAADYGIQDPVQQRDLLGHIVEKASSLKNIINDLFDLTRIQSGQLLTLNREPCDLCGLIRTVVDSYRKGCSSHRFVLELPDQCPIVVVDQKKMAQVMENLLSNAVKFSPIGSAIRVVGTVEEREFLYTIEDQGIGMTAEQRARVFDKFYRGDASNTAVGGLGLGMAIVKSIIEGHEGSIRVESEPDRGTRVIFSLPLATP